MFRSQHQCKFTRQQSEWNQLEARSENFANQDDLIKRSKREWSQLKLILRARVRQQRSFRLISERAFTWHSRNNQSRLEIYFGTRLDAIASGTHDIEQSIALFLNAWPDVNLRFLAFEKNFWQALSVYTVVSLYFRGNEKTHPNTNLNKRIYHWPKESCINTFILNCR